MDVLSALLDGPLTFSARGAFLIKSVFTPPWALRVEDRAPLSLVTVARGEAWVVPDRSPPSPLRPGQVAVLRGPEPYTLADHPDTRPRIWIDPDQNCRTEDGQDVTETLHLGVRTWGTTPQDHSTVLLSGTYQGRSAVAGRLLDAVPPTLVRTAGPEGRALLDLLGAEIVTARPGQQLFLDRLLDLLLVSVLRDWLAEAGADAPGWYQAQADPVVGPALDLMHRHPSAHWTVEGLAHRVGVSRAALSRRFSRLIGEPPMTYLAGWRLSLAADLLSDPDTTVATVARQVGYGSPFALSTAFKRVRGVSPREYRADRLAPRPAPLSSQVVLGR
ncbi:AraC family transcriptional regulator [Streptomyces sp. NPDC005438]|uniref:AraC family transcriptional regulator n=1 Tax=Streptomyces sp. NPDC005438 TaxID=3156880 RepID=UPI0033A18972